MWRILRTEDKNGEWRNHFNHEFYVICKKLSTFKILDKTCCLCLIEIKITIGQPEGKKKKTDFT